MHSVSEEEKECNFLWCDVPLDWRIAAGQLSIFYFNIQIQVRRAPWTFKYVEHMLSLMAFDRLERTLLNSFRNVFRRWAPNHGNGQWYVRICFIRKVKWTWLWHSLVLKSNILIVRVQCAHVKAAVRVLPVSGISFGLSIERKYPNWLPGERFNPLPASTNDAFIRFSYFNRVTRVFSWMNSRNSHIHPFSPFEFKCRAEWENNKTNFHDCLLPKI